VCAAQAVRVVIEDAKGVDGHKPKDIERVPQRATQSHPKLFPNQSNSLLSVAKSISGAPRAGVPPSIVSAAARTGSVL
jgi:hypothetical protein